jgi:FKBP-type peptidyl-prolyl cis-trans isomerase FkpA
MGSKKLLLIALLLVAAGCGDRGTAAGNIGEPTEVSYARRLNVDLAAMTRTPSGLYYRDLEVGTGQTAEPWDVVAVHYTGWLPDGSQFDSSRDVGEPFLFQIGTGNVIDGWDEGVAGMSVGGRRQLVIPPDLGYGESGVGGVIPPNATLVFDVELLEVR